MKCFCFHGHPFESKGEFPQLLHKDINATKEINTYDAHITAHIVSDNARSYSVAQILTLHISFKDYLNIFTRLLISQKL